MNKVQQLRLYWRLGFFLLFLVAPALDIFRLDLSRGHFIIFGMPWTLGVVADDALRTSINILLRVFLPIVLFIAVGFWLSWRYGRLYCGWLCPHFSVVETINALMRRAIGKPTLWEAERLPERQSDGVEIRPDKRRWWLVVAAVVFFSWLWAVTLLTYLLPPAEVWSNLFSGQLSRNQALFIGVATLLLAIEFSLARHLFCRFGCAVGLFQSLIWMANRRALVVGFDREHAAACVDCDSSCEHACPMRLKPRQIKRKMFTCTQCQQCIQACESVNLPKGKASLLQMVEDQCALDVSERDFGRKPQVPGDCFSRRLEKGVLKSAGDACSVDRSAVSARGAENGIN